MAAQLKESNDMIQKLLSRMDSKEETIIEKMREEIQKGFTHTRDNGDQM